MNRIRTLAALAVGIAGLGIPAAAPARADASTDTPADAACVAEVNAALRDVRIARAIARVAFVEFTQARSAALFVEPREAFDRRHGTQRYRNVVLRRAARTDLWPHLPRAYKRWLADPGRSGRRSLVKMFALDGNRLAITDSPLDYPAFSLNAVLFEYADAATDLIRSAGRAAADKHAEVLDLPCAASRKAQIRRLLGELRQWQIKTSRALASWPGEVDRD